MGVQVCHTTRDELDICITSILTTKPISFILEVCLFIHYNLSYALNYKFVLSFLCSRNSTYWDRVKHRGRHANFIVGFWTRPSITTCLFYGQSTLFTLKKITIDFISEVVIIITFMQRTECHPPLRRKFDCNSYFEWTIWCYVDVQY